jgi:TolA-binding protein
MNTSVRLALLCLTLVTLSGCVYWNTFYNARKAFNEAEKTRKAARFRSGRIKGDLYQMAIDKSMKVIDNYPNSKYYDDALFVLGVSFYYTKRYVAAERRLRELLANYGDSKYAQEAQLYLAKAKLELREEDEAMEIFQTVFNENAPKRFKVEAALALGDYHLNNYDYERAQEYFRPVRDSLGDKYERKAAQRLIADAYYEDFKFRDALGAYLQLLGLKPDKNEKYHSLYQAALCSFMMMQIDDGLNYLTDLAENETYWDSLGVLKLRMAEGYEYREEIAEAEAIYEKILAEEEKKDIAGEAAYRLGLIYQFDYDDLVKAKEYYDKTVKLNRNSEVGKDALQRSSDIGKIETYSRTIKLDSTVTQDMLDEAAATQYQLAELYWFSLNKPDSAMVEMRYVIDSFPKSSFAPKAIVALAQMYEDLLSDTTTARQLLKIVPRNYPNSDYVPEVLEALGLLGTEADTGYAELYLRKAEHFVVDEKNYDSARYYYQYIIDNFEHSKYYEQSAFSLIFIEEEFAPPGDSSIIFAYSDFIDSFPNSTWAGEAENRLVAEVSKSSAVDESADTSSGIRPDIDDESRDIFGGVEQDTTVSEDYRVTAYIGPNGQQLVNITLEPTEIREEFEYPVEAYRTRWEGDLYFQILLDFSGEVVDHILKVRCDVEEINIEAEKTVASMVFDALRIPLEQQDSYLVYKFQVRIPDHLR